MDAISVVVAADTLATYYIQNFHLESRGTFSNFVNVSIQSNLLEARLFIYLVSFL